MLDILGSEPEARLPNTIVLPPGSLPDEERWRSHWPDLAEEGPSAAWAERWRTTVRRAYEDHRDH